MSYTAIQPDEPVEPVAPAAPAAPAAPQAPSTGTPTTLRDRLRESSHPIALLCYIFFRIAPIFTYIFGNLFLGFVVSKNRFVLHFIILILLVSADFWNLKNIAGRLLVGLRWWNETNPIEGTLGEFENVWVFETVPPTQHINIIDSKVFWILIYAQPAAWSLLGVLALLKFQFLYLLLVIMALSLSLTNALAFTKCDKFGKANNFASGLLSSATTSFFSRFNPFSS